MLYGTPCVAPGSVLVLTTSGGTTGGTGAAPKGITVSAVSIPPTLVMVAFVAALIT